MRLYLSDYDVFSGPSLNHWVSGGSDPSIHDVKLPCPAYAQSGENYVIPDREIFLMQEVVEPDGIEPTTSCLQSTRSTN